VVTGYVVRYGQAVPSDKRNFVTSLVVTRAINVSFQVVNEHGERTSVESPIFPMMGGVGSYPTCLGTATKRIEEVGSTKRKPTHVSRSKEIFSRERVEAPCFQAEARMAGADSSKDLRLLKVK
jgi:hypothetical protein